MKLSRLVIVLSIVCLLSGLSLSFIYTGTQKRITENKIKKEILLKQSIIPSAVKFVLIEKFTQFIKVEECLNEENKIVGYIIQDKFRAYGGDVEYLIGLYAEQRPKILNIKIISHKETPGLGSKISSEKFLSQFRNIFSSEELYLKKDSLQGKIESITGATISSQKITEAIRKVISDETLKHYLNEKFSLPQEIKKEVQKKTISLQSTIQQPEVSQERTE